VRTQLKTVEDMIAANDPLPRYRKGIVLRRLSALDFGSFQAYRSDLELGRYQGWIPMLDAEAQAFLEDMSTAPLFRPGHWIQVGVAEPDGLALLGDIGLYLADDASYAEIGFTLARHAQGCGVATNAVRTAIEIVFQCTTAARVIGVTDARNHASIAVLVRAGMQKQEERTAVFRGESCIEYVYSIEKFGERGA
jgi:[ribosomal protein S5]-alanine N-acetyltransferase